MEYRYQGHLIRPGARSNADTDQWTPTLTVFSGEGDNGKVIEREILFRKTFSTARDAEECAHQFAINWISAGKPQLPAT